MSTQKPSHPSKADLDNRSRQLNPQDPTYYRSRGQEPPKGSPKK